ncbi:MAG: DNA-processing protein DprA [Oscillibacter sp.]|jgi:DNA processing protein|nr:DNA-processing protein DprA [Oscillibacter sp.]
MSALKYWIWLCQRKGLRSQTRLGLLEHFAAPEDIYCADPGELLLSPEMTREQAELLADKDLSAAERVLESCAKAGISLLTMQDAAYPDRLRNIYDPPCLLYCRGRLPAMDEEAAVAAVGTRRATPYGIRAAERLGFELAAGGAAVVTGMARGIDSAAAKGALRGGGTVVGVLGNGPDVIYPPENRELYEDVAAAGALISEYAPGTEPAGNHFPVRNRILSGLCLATLVVEAPERSGALITAQTALEQGRDVYAVPGPIDAPMSRGCNDLIRQGAGLVTRGWDILQDYAGRWPEKLREDGGAYRKKPDPGTREPGESREPPQKVPRTLSLSSKEGAALTDDQTAILRALTDEPMLTDDLIERTQIPARRVSSALTMLELDSYVLQSAGKRYARNVVLSE